MSVCMCVCSRKTLFSLFAQTFHSFVLLFFSSFLFLSCKMHDKLTRRELDVVVQRLQLLLLLGGRLRLSVLLVRIRYVRYVRIRVDATPAATKTKNALRLFFLLRFVLGKVQLQGDVEGASRGGGTLTLEGTKRNTAACLGASYSGTKTTKYSTFRKSIVYSHLL